jgi:hypothetical protein
MKLSNKILIGFFGFAFLYLTAVFAEVRLRGTPNIINDANSIAETVDIPGIAYIILRGVHDNVNVIGSDQPRLEVRSHSGDQLKSLQYKFSGDTLILTQLPSETWKPVKVSVFVRKSDLKGLTVDSAAAVVSGLELTSLHITQRTGTLRMSSNKIGKVNMQVSAGSFTDVSGEVDTLSASIEQSEAHISSPIPVLEGSMKNKSFLRVTEIGVIQFEKDETSRLNIYQ